MARRIYTSDIVEQGKSVLDAWNKINEQMTFGDLTFNKLLQDINAVGPVVNRMTSLENELTDLRNQRDALYLGISEKIKRVRRGIAANYGDDSSQYEMVGGKRLSERKSPTRRASAAQ